MDNMVVPQVEKGYKSSKIVDVFVQGEKTNDWSERIIEMQIENK